MVEMILLNGKSSSTTNTRISAANFLIDFHSLLFVLIIPFFD
jgi:hypothetical protein